MLSVRSFVRLLVRYTLSKSQAPEVFKTLSFSRKLVTFITIPKCLNVLQVCSALREELESQHEIRLAAANKKFTPVIVKDEPSRKV